MKEPLETAELLAFARTVESKSLSRAAQDLGVPRATISRRLARLEERLKVRLLKRTTRRLSVTDAGEALYAHAQRVLEALSFAEECVKQREGGVRGELRVSVPPIQSDAFRKLIADFIDRYPDVRMSLQLSSAYVDLLGAGYDVALRASTRLEPGLVAKTLLRSKLSCVASPAYLAKHGTPKTAAELRQHRCLMGFAKGEIPETEWPLVSGSRLRLSGVFHSNDPGILRALARAGLGVTLLPQMMLKSDLEAGKLVEILDGVVGSETRVSVVYAEREFIPAQVRAFIDEITRWAPSELATDATKQSGRVCPEKNDAQRNDAQKKRPAKKEPQKDRPAKRPKRTPSRASPARASRERAARSGRTTRGAR